MKFYSNKASAIRTANKQQRRDNLQHLSPASCLLLAAVLGQLLLTALGIQILQIHGALRPQSTLAVGVFTLFNYALAMVLVVWIISGEARRGALNDQKRETENIRGLLRVMRTQRHDLMNHLQTLTALFQTGREKAGREYLTALTRVNTNTNEAVQCADPILAAFLQARVHQAPAHRVDFELELEDPAGPLPVPTAYTLVGVLGNLLDNASEAVAVLPAGQRKITCAINRYGEGLLICVRDSGPGIAPEDRERIFDHGFSTRGAGRGLGLALVRDVVTGVGGRVEVSHNPTTFTVWFPLHEVAQ